MTEVIYKIKTAQGEQQGICSIKEFDFYYKQNIANFGNNQLTNINTKLINNQNDSSLNEQKTKLTQDIESTSDKLKSLVMLFENIQSTKILQYNNRRCAPAARRNFAEHKKFLERNAP